MNPEELLVVILMAPLVIAGVGAVLLICNAIFNGNKP